VAKGYSQTFSETSTTTHTYQFGPGMVWQWQFTITDPCGSSIIMGKDLRLTAAMPFPPCCIPGWEKNITDPHGDCYPDSSGKLVNLCG
jgi:hypothetical protein